jgi:bacterioferritin (cytochrome b1)
MDSDGFLRACLTRRRLLRGAGATVAAGSCAALLAGCADDTKNAAVKTAPDESDTADVELLNTVLDLELMSIEAYKAGAAQLAGRELQIAKGFLEQEQAHVDTLGQAIKALDGVPNVAKSRYDFPALRSQRQVLRFAVSFENDIIAAYIDVLPKLSQGEIRSTISAILTCEAEHVSVLAGALHEPQVPAAFVFGRAA